MAPKAVLYARVSSEKQAEKDLSIPAQLRALKKHAESKGYDVVRNYVDEAESARTAHRPAFQEMIAASKNRNRQFDVILVWKLSRFARNREDSIIYKSLLRRHGVQLISINEQIDDTPTGKLFEGIIEVMDEFYSANLAQDTKRGMRESASRGYFSGGTPPIGYLIDRSENGSNGKGRFVLDENFAGLVRRIFDLALSGRGAKEITKTLNSEGLKNNRGHSWNKNGVLYILGNELYTGTLIWGRNDKTQQPLRREDNHPAIVSKQEFAIVRNLVGGRSPIQSKPRSLTSDYLLSGLIYCGNCGYSLQGMPAKSGRYHYYGCLNSIRKGKTECSACMINRDKIESLVIEQLKLRVLTEDNLRDLLRLTNEALIEMQTSDSDQVSELKRHIDREKRKLDNLYKAVESGKVDLEDLAPRIRELRLGVDESTRQLSEIESTSCKPLDILTKRELKDYVCDLRQLLSEGSIFERKGFIKSFVKRITVTGKEVSITYTYPEPEVTKGSGNTGSGGAVLCSAQKSSPGRARTSDPLINSQLLYRLSYRGVCFVLISGANINN